MSHANASHWKCVPGIFFIVRSPNSFCTLSAQQKVIAPVHTPLAEAQRPQNA
jgi:hypothetical protein